MKRQPSISKATDEQVVEIVTSGDTEAYGEIMNRYQAKLIRYVNRYCRDEDQAQDAVQNAFIKAYINLNGFNTKLKFSSWMYRIAHNEAINLIKKHKKELIPDDEDWFSGLADDEQPAGVDIDKKLLRKMLNRQIGKLDSKYQEPLILHYFEGQSYSEISDILRLPSATVGTRIARGKRQMKKALEAEGINYEW